MTPYDGGSPFITSLASNSSMFPTTAVGAGRRDSGPIFPSPFRVWSRVLRAFDAMLAEPFKTWMRLERDLAELRSLDDRDLRDIRINRVDIAAMRAGTYKHASSDIAERIVVCPEVGKPATRTLTEHAPGSLTVRWDERPPARHDLHAASRRADTERPVLIAQWFIGADGRLVCHWQPQEQGSAARERTTSADIAECVA